MCLFSRKLSESLWYRPVRLDHTTYNLIPSHSGAILSHSGAHTQS